MSEMNEVKACRVLEEYKIELIFSDGFCGVIDFENHVKQARGPMLKPLQDLKIFHQAGIDSELGTIAWPNGYDICPDVLRYWCELGRVCSQEQLDEAFASNEDHVLKEKYEK
ncbi:MAG: DUF2442 domain-containing protein [Limisphaerales bacterium]